MRYKIHETNTVNEIFAKKFTHSGDSSASPVCRSFSSAGCPVSEGGSSSRRTCKPKIELYACVDVIVFAVGRSRISNAQCYIYIYVRIVRADSVFLRASRDRFSHAKLKECFYRRELELRFNMVENCRLFGDRAPRFRVTLPRRIPVLVTSAVVVGRTRRGNRESRDHLGRMFSNRRHIETVSPRVENEFESCDDHPAAPFPTTARIHREELDFLPRRK